MAAELINRGRKISEMVGNALDSVLDRLHNEERGSLDDEEKMFDLVMLIVSASQRIWVEGKFDPRVKEILEKGSRNMGISPKVDRRAIDSEGPLASMVVDNRLIVFEGSQFLVMWKPSKRFLREFEEPFEREK